MLKVDFGGCGKGGEWRTINKDDGEAHAAPDIVADITAAAHALDTAFEPQSVDEARCIHALEHLPPWDVLATLAYWRGFLKPGARLLIVVPDMRAIFETYLDGWIDAETAMGMIYVPAEWQQKAPGEAHRWGFDEDTLCQRLNAAGYHDVRRIDYPHGTFRVDDSPVPNLAVEAFA